MFWIITVLIILTIVIALFVFPELGKFALNLGTRLMKWDGILLIVVVIFIVFFMYAKNKQMENKQLELQAVLKQEEIKQEKQNSIQKELPAEQAKEVQKQEAVTQEKSKETKKQELLALEQSKDIQKKKDIEDLRNLVNNWLKNWEAGRIETYRTFYTSDFHSKGKNLDAWISYKTDVHNKSKNIKISIDDLQISVSENKATAVFIQHYSSSITKDSAKKTLELKKENNQWKIYGEIM